MNANLRHAAAFAPDFAGWRQEARALLAADIRPDQIDWRPTDFQQTDLFSAGAPPPLARLSEPRAELRLPAAFLRLAEAVACIRGQEHWPVLYRFAYRLRQEGAHLLQVSTDPDRNQLYFWEKAIRRDIHKMHAFVRFKLRPGSEIYEAWYEPEHRILEAAVPFFVRRFGDKPWAIFTPDGSAYWDGTTLRLGRGLDRAPFGDEDPFDDIWREYYRSTFNPARTNAKAMRAEMPEKFWRNLPEARVIRQALREAPARVQEMARQPHYLAEPPTAESLSALAMAAAHCSACPLHEKASRTVFGRGAQRAPLFFVGEQPGDEEDQAGAAFVGPAGKVLAEAFLFAGLREGQSYLTNAVKHFKWTPGDRPEKPRIHKTPSGADVSACRPWLDHEIRLVQPRVLVALGRNAGLSLLGRVPNVARERGRPITAHRAQPVIITWHPAAILRAANEDEAAQRMAELVADLQTAAKIAGAPAAP